jgi:hypothetical protein
MVFCSLPPSEPIEPQILAARSARLARGKMGRSLPLLLLSLAALYCTMPDRLNLRRSTGRTQSAAIACHCLAGDCYLLWL